MSCMSSIFCKCFLHLYTRLLLTMIKTRKFSTFLKSFLCFKNKLSKNGRHRDVLYVILYFILKILPLCYKTSEEIDPLKSIFFHTNALDDFLPRFVTTEIFVYSICDFRENRDYTHHQIATFYSSFTDIKKNYNPQSYVRKMHSILRELGFSIGNLLQMVYYLVCLEVPGYEIGTITYTIAAISNICYFGSEKQP